MYPPQKNSPHSDVRGGRYLTSGAVPRIMHPLVLKMLHAFVERHPCVAAPAGCAVRLVVQIVQVVHVGIGLHLERVQPVARILQSVAVAVGQQPVPAVAQVE